MDKLTAKQVRRLSADIAASDADYDVEFVGGTLTDFLNQLADALEAKEQAESRLKEAMLVMWPGPVPEHVERVQEGDAFLWVPDNDEGIGWTEETAEWCDRAYSFERAFGVKVEEWKP